MHQARYLGRDVQRPLLSLSGLLSLNLHEFTNLKALWNLSPQVLLSFYEDFIT